MWRDATVHFGRTTIPHLRIKFNIRSSVKQTRQQPRWANFGPRGAGLPLRRAFSLAVFQKALLGIKHAGNKRFGLIAKTLRAVVARSIPVLPERRAIRNPRQSVDRVFVHFFLRHFDP
jgi:hypothetical protein